MSNAEVTGNEWARHGRGNWVVGRFQRIKTWHRSRISPRTNQRTPLHSPLRVQAAGRTANEGGGGGEGEGGRRQSVGRTTVDGRGASGRSVGLLPKPVASRLPYTFPLISCCFLCILIGADANNAVIVKESFRCDSSHKMEAVFLVVFT